MQDLIELLEFELDEVAGGNPNFFSGVTISVSAISSTVTAEVNAAFSNSPAAAIDATINQNVS